MSSHENYPADPTRAYPWAGQKTVLMSPIKKVENLGSIGSEQTFKAFLA